MPKAAYQKDDKSISHFHPGAALAATQWYVQVISEPTGRLLFGED